MKRTHDNYRIDYNENIRINKQICSAKNARELIDIYDHNKLNFNYINISTIIHRFAKMKGDKNFIIGLIPLITDNLRNFDSQHLANLVWAFAKLNIKNEELFDLLTKEVSYKIKDFDPQETANLAWSFAKLDIKNKELFELLGKEASYKIKDFKPQAIANLAWSFATLSIKNIELFDLLIKEAFCKIRDFNPQEIANLAWSFATLNIKNEELFDLLSKETFFKIKDFKAQNIANLTWSFAVLDIRNIELFELLINTKDYNISEKFQMYQVYLHCKYELKSDRLINLLEKLDFSTFKENVARSSNLHLDCSLRLQLLDINHQNEININGLYCDIYLPDKNIIIEINGPFHYTHLDIEPLGRTVFKSRLLKAMVYIVKTIPYWDWNDMGNSEEKKSYLLNLLK